MSHTTSHEGGAAQPEGGRIGVGTWERPDKPASDEVARVRFTSGRPSWIATRATPDSERSRLRRLLMDVDIAVAHMRSSVDVAAMHERRVAVDALTEALDLGAEPRVAACQTCGRLGMVAATICGFCWTARRSSA